MQDIQEGVLLSDSQVKQVFNPPTEPEKQPEEKLFDKDSYKRAFPRYNYALQQSWCGHRVDTEKVPVGLNCFQCAVYWFGANKEFTQACINTFQAGYEKQLTKAHGAKFVKLLARFIVFAREQQADAQ